MQMVHWILPVFLVLSIFTSHDRSWLQNGQLNWVSNAVKVFLLGGGPRFDFLRPISTSFLIQKSVTRPEKI